ncbi:hypothetical protein [Bacillus wiedmannii]|uniref:Uncharacterized protein n=1 Tax=Bacillus wiedmannii TaxID=1890302 RepID=A0ABX5DK47_9BACI|nr:hypothetical protein [Bacillus wiedmannii]PRT35308.1 hypothetical protein C6357_29370 [Bacillus wiedmannii]
MNGMTIEQCEAKIKALELAWVTMYEKLDVLAQAYIEHDLNKKADEYEEKVERAKQNEFYWEEEYAFRNNVAEYLRDYARQNIY